MQAPSKPVSASVHGDGQLPVATFKNSLRAWQAGYKAKRANRPTFCETPSKQATSAYGFGLFTSYSRRP
jgi:hypothetical protein